MNDYTRTEKMNFYSNRKLESGKTWLLFLLFGWSYGSMGKMGKQIFFYITFAGFGLWFLYVLFTLSNKIKEHNRSIAKDLGMDLQDLNNLGL
jgi:ABC-type Fe3+-siderophore transport system permease subunit